MSQNTTLILLPQTAYTPSTPNTTVNGVMVPGASYYLSGQNLQTVSFATTTFIGTVVIQASVLDTPATDNDWFTILNIVFPIGTTTNTFNNLTGNYVWLRAVIRNFSQGTVEHIKVSY